MLGDDLAFAIINVIEVIRYRDVAAGGVKMKANYACVVSTNDILATGRRYNMSL